MSKNRIINEIINTIFVKTIKILNLPVSIFLVSILLTNIYPQTKSDPSNKTDIVFNYEVTKFGALAVDRRNGYYYGWASDCLTLPEAEKKAIEECNKKGGKCTVVLSYSGSGCAAYRSSAGKNVGIAFGWGIGKTKEEADAIAKKECSIRSYGMASPNFVWSCNTSDAGTLTQIYNATKEIISIEGDPEDY